MKRANLQRAIEVAVRLHADQYRDGETPLPYVTHPIEVLINLRYVGRVTDEEMLCAAVLHDTVESSVAEFGEIEQVFGPRVRKLVEELTRQEPTLTEILGLGKREIWRLRADMLIEEISKMSPDAQQIKLADRLANVHDAHQTKSGEKLKRYLWQTKRILDTIPRSRNKWLWDAVQAEAERVRSVGSDLSEGK